MSAPAVELARYTSGLTETESGLWVAGDSAALSYPDEVRRLYDDLEGQSFWFAHRNAVIHSAVERYPPPGPLFDVGGGNGTVAAYLVARGVPTVVVEPGPEGAKAAWARGLRPVVCARLDGACFHDGSLPAISLFDVVEHIEADRAFLDVVRGRLADDGWLYLTVPAHPWLWSAEDTFAGHYRRYRRRDLRAIVEAAGFEIVWLTGFFQSLVVPILVARAIPSHLGIRRADGRLLSGDVGLRMDELPLPVLVWMRRERRHLEQHGSVRLGSSILLVARPVRGAGSRG